DGLAFELDGIGIGHRQVALDHAAAANGAGGAGVLGHDEDHVLARAADVVNEGFLHALDDADADDDNGDAHDDADHGEETAEAVPPELHQAHLHAFDPEREHQASARLRVRTSGTGGPPTRGVGWSAMIIPSRRTMTRSA